MLTPPLYTDINARLAFSVDAVGLSYDSATGVVSLATGYVIPTTIDESNWNTAYGWGNHAGLYDAAGTAASAVSGHESTYNHSLIASALQTETDPVVGAVDGIVKSDGDGNISAAVAGTDYLNASSQVVHNQTSGYVANQHIDWTNATADLSTTGRVSATRVLVDVSLQDPGIYYPLRVYSKPRFTQSGTYQHYASMVDLRPTIDTGATNSSGNTGLQISVLRNQMPDAPSDSGALNALTGTQMSIGHYGALPNESPQTTNVYGYRVYPFTRTGTITNLYAFYAGAKDGSATVTSYYCFYAADPTAKAYFAGNVQAGGFLSSDGTLGATKDVIITAGQNVTLHFKNGLFVGSD
jgi:hypothetical protein